KTPADSKAVSPVWQAAHAGPVRRALFNARGDRVISAGDDHTVKIWSAADSREMKSIVAHDGPVTGLAVSSDGAKVVSAGADKVVKVWTLASLKPDVKDTPTAVLPLPGPAQDVALSPDGTRIAAAFAG